MALSADAVWEVLCWLDDRCDWRWLFLLLAGQHDLRRPLPLLTVRELFDRREDAFVAVRNGAASLAELALEVGHAGAYRRHAPAYMPRDKAIEAFRWACANGHLELAQWFAKTFAVTPEESKTYDHWAFRLACANDHLEVAQWLAKAFGITPAEAKKKANWTFRWACTNGHLEVAQWLAEAFVVTPEEAKTGDNWAFRWACANDHLEVAQWLAKTFAVTPEEAKTYGNWAFHRACANDHREVVSWLKATFGAFEHGPARSF